MDYPATIDVQTPEKIANWRALVNWILGIPHLVISSVLQDVAWVLAIVSWFSIVFTGKVPVGIANFQVMVARYAVRANTFAGFLYEDYPPFEYRNTPEDPGGSPAVVTITPKLEDRDRLTVGLRFLWVIPAALFAFVISIVGMICWFLGFFAVLFTGRWPDGLRDWVMRTLRVWIRLTAYAMLLTDEYPPFSTD